MTHSAHTADFYVRLRADFTMSGAVRSIKATALTQGVPSCDGNEYVVRLRLRVPDRAFDPPVTEVDVQLADIQPLVSTP